MNSRSSRRRRRFFIGFLALVVLGAGPVTAYAHPVPSANAPSAVRWTAQPPSLVDSQRSPQDFGTRRRLPAESAGLRDGAGREAAGPEYIVQPGDSLYTIALAFGTTVEALQEANAIDNPALLSVGARLLIPGYEGVQGVLTTHDLGVGDTLASLPYRLAMPLEALVQLNRIVNPTALYLGQSIVYAEAEADEQAPPVAGRYVSADGHSTLPGLAARYGVTVAELIQWNELSGTTLHAGLRLFVPGGDQPPTWLPSPVRRLELNPVHPVQGGPLTIVAELEGEAQLGGTLGETPLTFVSEGNTAVALHGIHAFAEPGVYPLVIAVLPAEGEPTGIELQVPISDGGYEYQAITLPAEQNALLDAAVVDAEFAVIAAATAPVTPVRHWEGPFVVPVDSDRITAGFGLRRSYNGGSYSSFHGGIDYGGPSTTPIVAAAAGEVVLAERLQIRGNATVIDHGWGVYTGYWHQSESLVSVGDFVMAGQQIGLIGSTGLSTGNHLHWEVWIGGNQVNPAAWVDLSFP